MIAGIRVEGSGFRKHPSQRILDIFKQSLHYGAVFGLHRGGVSGRIAAFREYRTDIT